MFTIKKFVTVESLDEAYLLNQARSNAVLGGTLWMKMGKRAISKAIDLSGLELDQVEENDEEFVIGCMCTLRDLEVHEGLNAYYSGIIAESLKHVVGVQFRNGATVGGTVFSRYGFSDLITALLSLDTYVELYQGGIISLEKFLKKEIDNDILVHVIIKKSERQAAYLSKRNTKTDFPTLALSVSLLNGKWRISIGARPQRAALAKEAAALLSEEPTAEEIAEAAAWIKDNLTFGTNMRGSAQYRQLLAGVLLERGIKKVVGGKH